jgi:hypothetical protein
MIACGSLVVANVRVGSLIMAFAMLVQVATKDNPMLTDSDFAWHNAFLNMLKDLAIVAVSILIFTRKPRLLHRRDLIKSHKD